MMESFKNLFKKKQEPKPETKVKKESKPVVSKTAKEIATENGEPYVAIVNVDIDPDDIGTGAFELDWNDKFIANLVRSGYQVKANEPENEIVDRWFATVCRNVALETYEQEMADPERRQMSRRRLDKDRTEFS